VPLIQDVLPPLPAGSGSETSSNTPEVAPGGSSSGTGGLDVTVARDGDNVVLDVKLYNRGGQSAVVKRMQLQVLRAARFRQGLEEMAALIPSGTYDLKLPVPEEVSAAPVVKDLSQVVAPYEAERFLVRLHADVPEFARFLYLLRLELIYDTNDRSVRSRPFAVVCPKAIKIWTPENLEFVIDYKLPYVAKIVLDEVGLEYPELVGILALADTMSDDLHTAFAQAQKALQQLPALRNRLGARMAGESQ
jgi:hypothetical protein